MAVCGITRRGSQWVNGALQSNIRCGIAGLGRREGVACPISLVEREIAVSEQGWCCKHLIIVELVSGGRGAT